MSQFYFARDTKVFLTPTGSTAVAWEIPVLDGMSFSQSTETTEITLNEMTSATGTSRRSRQLFTDAFNPSEWSFSTYMRPFGSVPAGSGDIWEPSGSISGNPQHAVEEPLWAYMVGSKQFTIGTGSAASKWTSDGSTVSGVTNSDTNMIVDWTASEVPSLPEFDLYIELGGARDGNDLTYKLSKCVVNEAAIDFDIDGIATINWSGFGQNVAEFSTNSGNPPSFTKTISEGIHNETRNFIKNRLTALTCVGTNISGTSTTDTYNLVLTGGNITISNNVTFLTPETLGVVNLPIGNVTGTRTITGNATCYLNSAADGSADLFEELAELTNSSANASAIVNSFALNFLVGGSGNTPRVEISLPKAHLEVPQHAVDDIISVDVNFHGLPASVNPGATANNYESKLTYVGPDLT